MATINVSVVEGRGSVIAKINGAIIRTINPGDGVIVVTCNIGDTFEFTAYPDTTLGYSFNKFCGDTACVLNTTANPLSGTVTSDAGYVGAYFKAQCIIQSYGFVVQGNMVGTPTCTALTSDSIGVEADVSFDSSAVGKNFYLWFDILRPDGKTSQFWGNNGNSYFINSAGTYTLSQSNVIASSDPTGVYKINSIYIIASDKVSFVCNTQTSAYGCTQLTLNSPVNHWTVDIYVKDSMTGANVSAANVTVGSQSGVTDSNGHVQFTVAEGTISISITKSMYVNFTATELVFTNKTLTYQLVPLGSNVGNISFTSTPSGAEIYISGGDMRQKTNSVVKDIRIGTYSYVLKLAGYNDFTGSIDVKAMTTVYVNAVLVPTSTGSGTLYITSSPTGADVIIDGTPQNTQTPASIVNVPVGSHNIILKKLGYQDYTQTISVVSGMTTSVNATLVALSGYGIWDVSSNPSGAKIFIDGVDTQKVTPYTFNNLISGDHTFKISLSGYNDESGVFTIVSGNTTQSSVTLTQSGISSDLVIGVTVIAIGAAGLYLAIKESKHREVIRQ